MREPLIEAENWKQPLDVTLPVGCRGELLVPFSRHIRQSSINPPTSHWSFPQYSRLPAELQLRVLRCCDKPTLFQLMHTSRDLRADSERLFFSDPETWYQVSGEWLIKGGTASGTMSDTGFLARVERLRIDFYWMHQETWADGWHNEEEAVVESYENICRFWEVFQRRFPRAKHVVLGDVKDRYVDSLPTTEYKNVGHLSPPNIEIYISLIEVHGNSGNRLKRKLWRRVKSEGALNTAAVSEWKECTDFLTPIVIPPEKPYRGPVGELYGASGAEWSIQSRAIRVHKITAMEKYHLQALPESFGSEPHSDGQQGITSFKPFRCLAPDCDARFERPGEYTSHAIESGHDTYHDIPEPFKHTFAVNEERLKRMREIQSKKWHAVCDWWGKSGSRQREVAKREFIRQLRNDPLWMGDAPDEDWKVWEMIEVSLYGYP
ncbi:hypothetical protein DM02DRAFT_652987 [Periconia macrospinosa]|uniref:C2H2-type domain-containing protein n=1 Tax=Periconia macrospinosa TaxID=97972 RepID=A0A2V1DY38_9PLEO|nr:hypothetical protein DM02DRAFT_652987 [Periconia macrospinosa]